MHARNLVTKRWLIVHRLRPLKQSEKRRRGAAAFPSAWINRKCPEKSRICRDNRNSQRQWRLWQMHRLICKYLLQERVCGCYKSLWDGKYVSTKIYWVKKYCLPPVYPVNITSQINQSIYPMSQYNQVFSNIPWQQQQIQFYFYIDESVLNS